MTILSCGPLRTHIPAFRKTLVAQCYADYTITQKTRLLQDADDWLSRRGRRIEDFGESDIEAFVRHRKRNGGHRGGDRSTLQDLLQHLNGKGVVAVREIRENSPIDRLQARFNQYLLEERGLQASTRNWYLYETRRFLLDQFGNGPLVMEGIGPRNIAGFVLERANFRSARSMQKTGTALRSLFRFLVQCGETTIDARSAIPRIANWKSTGLPKYLASGEVEAVLEGCGRDTPEGRRSRAMLLLLARLGLRAGEVVALKLDDIDWDAGEILVYGKGRRQDRLPLPVDVGEALATYLRRDRPESPSRQVFVRLVAPYRGLAGPSSIGFIVRKTLKRAGLNPPFQGTHLFRHSLGTRMLRCGASLEEIGRILRHESPNTTAIYAKTNLEALRALALPWPGGVA